MNNLTVKYVLFTHILTQLIINSVTFKGLAFRLIEHLNR